MFGLGTTEVVVIALVIGILFFGSRRIIEFARSLGRVTGEYKKGKQAVDAELREMTSEKQDQ